MKLKCSFIHVCKIEWACYFCSYKMLILLSSIMRNNLTQLINLMRGKIICPQTLLQSERNIACRIYLRFAFSHDILDVLQLWTSNNNLIKASFRAQNNYINSIIIISTALWWTYNEIIIIYWNFSWTCFSRNACIRFPRPC